MTEEEEDKAFADAWNKPVVRGDLLRAILDLRMISGDLFDAIIASKNKQEDKILPALQRYIEKNKGLDKLVSYLEGKADE